ncbi:D-alanine--D-alanine ligase [Paenibacillus auburnensis]|uniref:D-alanine--D-alanine ligase n=1 Tax=Paenibacillus auburnensis TaxID=2905649 RepID=A0ABN8GT68_9BACL|nr:D-alanine--D-alanine ligase [Paenibacillus auburnensis]CAH1217575.1 D-alanine--D-alanine ligase [Paenibacillus auburnensis]
MLKVGVIMGGVSSEYEVSLNTGREMLKHLDRNKYEAVPVVITERGQLIDQVKGLDFALLALHGAYGEDGTVQGTLETLGIPYSGSGVLSSSLCMDKHLSKTILRSKGILTPDWLCWDSMDDYAPEAVERLGYPVMVKPNSGGSSIGMSKVNNVQELRRAVEKAFAEDRSILIEGFTEGQEITCPILGGDLLPVIGIRSLGADWFDYSAKYVQGGADERVIQLSLGTHERVRTAALACYKALKCSVYARVDMLLQNGVPYVLEVNTLPGMTETSLLPRSALVAGYTFSSLLDAIIAGSLQVRGDQAGEVQAAKEEELGQTGRKQAAEGSNEADTEAGEQAAPANQKRQEVVSHA